MLQSSLKENTSQRRKHIPKKREWCKKTKFETAWKLTERNNTNILLFVILTSCVGAVKS